jgi:hypothetical protein
MEEEFKEVPTYGPYFKWSSEKTWKTAAKKAGFYKTVTETDPETGDETTSEVLDAYTHEHSIDVVGVIYKGGKWDDEGNEIEAPVKQPGFHVNYLGPLPTGWDKKSVSPKTPVRVFA